MKNITILTFQRAKNYGAVLQAFALKTALRSICEHNVEILDYDFVVAGMNDNLKNHYKKRGKVKFIIFIFIKIIEKFLGTLFINSIKKREIKITSFIDKYLINPNQKRYNIGNVKTIDSDLYIVGSDQVWNYSIAGGDKTFFLEFVPEKSKKFSYAASFGFEDVFLKYKKECIDLLRNFEGISLREPIGYDVLSKEIKEPFIHIDPTLLLDASVWSGFTADTGEKYILVYNVIPPNKLYKAAKETAKKKRLKMIEITSGFSSFILNPKSKKLLDKSPEEFVSLIANAEYVFTTSFHGTTFSVLFKKKFFTELNCNNYYNHRVENLLNLLGLEERAIDNCGGDFSKEINWDSVDGKLNAERKKSFDYLAKITNI